MVRVIFYPAKKVKPRARIRFETISPQGLIRLIFQLKEDAEPKIFLFHKIMYHYFIH
jgi:hypothetical protein